jgi:glycosyltransferase involved in cell wall biosynthesis
MKDLAVLIAVYNDEPALLSALDSIDEPDNSFTVVIVDGGSDRPPVIETGRYPFETVLVQQESNEGLASGLNCGIDAIRERGFRFLARFDAGDVARKTVSRSSTAASRRTTSSFCSAATPSS